MIYTLNRYSPLPMDCKEAASQLDACLRRHALILILIGTYSRSYQWLGQSIDASNGKLSRDILIRGAESGTDRALRPGSLTAMPHT